EARLRLALHALGGLDARAPAPLDAVLTEVELGAVLHEAALAVALLARRVTQLGEALRPRVLVVGVPPRAELEPGDALGLTVADGVGRLAQLTGAREVGDLLLLAVAGGHEGEEQDREREQSGEHAGSISTKRAR